MERGVREEAQGSGAVKILSPTNAAIAAGRKVMRAYDANHAAPTPATARAYKEVIAAYAAAERTAVAARAARAQAAARAAPGCRTTRIGKHTLQTCSNPFSVDFEVKRVDGANIARATLKALDNNAYKVSYIEVDRSARQERLGTRLYERLVSTACKAGRTLESDSMRSPFAEAFWRKQQAKGRARCEGSPGYVYDEPIRALEERVDRGLLSRDAYEKILDKLPQYDKRTEHWPCRKYVVGSPCTTKSLKGLGRLR